MEDNTKIKRKENSEKIQFITKEKKLKKRGKIKLTKFKSFLNKTGIKIKNKIIKQVTSSNNDKKINDNKEVKKIRNPGVDLVRIISMYTIIFHHHLFSGNTLNFSLNIKDNYFYFIVLQLGMLMLLY